MPQIIPKILHISTVHPRRDTRIFYRECISLSKKGFETYLLVADGKGDEFIEGVQVLDIGVEKTRIKTFLRSRAKIKRQVEKLQPKVVHFHDPELMFIASQLFNKYKIPFVFDIHENIAVQILDKDYIPKFLRRWIALGYRWVENYFIKSFHLVIAEYSYEEVYKDKGKSLTTILNMPDTVHFKPYINTKRRGSEIFYIGGVSDERGLDVTLEALKILKSKGIDFFMHFIGRVVDEKVLDFPLKSLSENVKFYGRMDSKEGFKISQNCIVGLSVLKPIKNYVESYSTKIFEYMAIGLPVITSNFPLYKDVVEEYDTGYCIEPQSSIALADKIATLILNNDLANDLGLNGIKCVQKKFNWSTEEKKLLALYNGFVSEK